ncbi:19081_t:CDS:2, partial [Gigaspora margarita]
MKNSKIKKTLIEITCPANNLIDSSNESNNLPIDQSNVNDNIRDNNNTIFEVHISDLSQIIDKITKTENTKEFEIIVQFEILNQLLNKITRSIHEQIKDRSGYKWKHHKDLAKSAIMLIENKYQSKNCKLLIAKISDTLVAIAFSTLLFNKLKDIKEVHLDAIYKTAKGHFELYSLIAEKDGTGFALEYLVLNIKQDFTEISTAQKEIDLKLFPFIDSNFISKNKTDSSFLTPKEIWKSAVQDIYQFCVETKILSFEITFTLFDIQKTVGVYSQK